VRWGVVVKWVCGDGRAMLRIVNRKYNKGE